jgi:hypothetical protein
MHAYTRAEALYAYTYTHPHTHTPTHTHTQTHTNTRAHTHKQGRYGVAFNASMGNYIHTYTHTYTHVYMHICRGYDVVFNVNVDDYYAPSRFEKQVCRHAYMHTWMFVSRFALHEGHSHRQTDRQTDRYEHLVMQAISEGAHFASPVNVIVTKNCIFIYYIYIYIYMHTYTHTYTHILSCRLLQRLITWPVHLFVCVCIYIHTYIHTHIYIYIYIYIYCKCIHTHIPYIHAYSDAGHSRGFTPGIFLLCYSDRAM